jgi:hypothetical protein
MDDAQLLNDEPEDAKAADPPPKPIPTHIKVLVCAMLFIVGIAIGSVGHSIYTYETPPTPESLQALSSMVSRMNLSASPCSALYSYACGTYVEQHFPFSGASVFGELVEEASAAAYHAFDAHALNAPNEPASIFYRKCREAKRQTTSDCTITAEPGPALVKAIWEHGYAVNDLFVDRTTSPYVQNSRSFAIFHSGYTAGSLKRPLEITDATDPCHLFQVLQLVYACDPCEDGTILLYGETETICSKWGAIQANETETSLAAQELATQDCLNEMPYGKSLELCVEHTSSFYTSVSRAYAETETAEVKKISLLFAKIQSTLVKIVKPLGKNVANKVKSVVLHSEWNANNQEPGPSLQSLMVNQSYAQLYLRSMLAKTQHSLQDRKFISPLWHMNSYDINAYYSPSENAIYLPTAMKALLRGVTFSSSLAFILAHELAHSIDPSSINYNKDGQYDLQMLSNEGSQYYTRYLNCIMVLNRERQLSEDFADRVSSQIVSIIAPESDDLFEFETFTLNAAQMDVLRMAQLWCSAESHEYFGDSHSPPRLRVEESMSALFTHEFNCPVEQQTCTLG